MNFHNFYLGFLCSKKIPKNVRFSGCSLFLYWAGDGGGGYCQKIGVWICRNSFSCRNKYVHVQEIVSEVPTTS